MNEDRLKLKQRWVIVTDATAAIYVGLAPVTGSVYRIVAAYGYQEEGSALNCYWTIDVGDGVGYIDLNDAVSTASGVKAQLYGTTGAITKEPLILRSGMELRFVATGKTVGHNVVIRALVEELRGSETYVG